ncbi:MAG: amidohydrolase family protein [Nitrospinota bacterium]
MSGSVLINNIGAIVSGDLKNPILKGDAIRIEDGEVAAIGGEADCAGEVEQTIDAGGMTVTPGLIDSHVHTTQGDFTPRQLTLNWIESCMQCGITSMITAGEVHTPGRPRDGQGAKAMAILAAKSFKVLRPGGVKVMAGAIMLEPGLKEADFAEMAEAGVELVGEVGLGSIREPEQVRPLLAWARANGMRVLCHTGGGSIPGSMVVDADMILAIGPNVACHLNGGPTGLPLDQIERVAKESNAALELVQCGNMKRAVEATELFLAQGVTERVIVGNDMPSGTGVIPYGVLRTLSVMAAFTDLSPEAALCTATGNTARIHKMDVGIVAAGKPADLVIMDAPWGSTGKDALAALKAGDTPSVACVLIDGVLRTAKSRNTPPCTRKVRIEGGHIPAAAGH